MHKTKNFVTYHRKIEGKTNYRKRLKLLVSGTPRLVVRVTNKNVVAQVIEYSPDGDKIIVTAHSSVLKKYGWNHSTSNLPAAYLTGFLAGKLAIAKKVDHAILDTGLQSTVKGSKLYATLKGAIDSGLDIPASDVIFPAEDRLKGKHIVDYAKAKPMKTNVADMGKTFEDVKSKITKGK